MPKPLDPQKREAIAQAIRDGYGTRSRNDIAKEFGVAARTVGKIAEQDNLDGSWDRTQTARASRAKQVDNRAVRAQLVEDLIGDAVRVRERLWEPCDVVTATGEIRTLLLPPAGDVRSFVSAIGAAIKTSIEVEKHDQGDSGADDAKSMLLGVAQGLQAIYDAGLADATPATAAD